MTHWRELIEYEMVRHKEAWRDVLSSTFVIGKEMVQFDNGWGTTCGDPFTVWTEKRVYFPVQYDGSEWCSSVSRNPDNIACEHVGGS